MDRDCEGWSAWGIGAAVRRTIDAVDPDADADADTDADTDAAEDGGAAPCAIS